LKLDDWLPDYQVRSRHQTTVQADTATTYQALISTSMGKLTLVKVLMGLRSLGRARHTPRPKTFIEGLIDGGFLPLAIEPNQELVFGIAGKFWMLTPERVALASKQDFADFTREGYAKAAWNISLSPGDADRTLLLTQTRIRCYGHIAESRFRAYWLVVGPFSGLIRRAMLRAVKRKAEQLAAAASR
jgi:hypothetical protein